MRQLNACRGFNSILVRLKVGDGFVDTVTFSKFQFHTGSIKRHGKDFTETAATMFQFHTGSIKS